MTRPTESKATERSPYYDLNVNPPSRMRRPQNRQDDTWIRAFLARAQVGQIATRWDDQPFINTTTFHYDEGRHEIIFHSNIVGRVRANAELAPQVCFSATEFGRLLPSNDLLELSMQYRGVVAFGQVRLLTDPGEAREALYALTRKYFPDLRPGHEARPIQGEHLRITSVYAIAVEHWSGKENWKDAADQTPDWPALPDSLLRGHL